MAKSFRLDDSGDGDTALTLVLTIIFLALSCVNLWIKVLPIVIYPAPLIAFLLTRWAYKRHFRNRIASLCSNPIDPS
jgi:hypothetical protein